MPTARVTIEDTNRTIVSDVYFKIIEDIVTKNMIDFNTFQDVLNYLKGVVEYCLS